MESGESNLQLNSLTDFNSKALLIKRKNTIIDKALMEKIYFEKSEMLKKYPSEWACDIRNNGKMIAFYDKT